MESAEAKLSKRGVNIRHIKKYDTIREIIKKMEVKI